MIFKAAIVCDTDKHDAALKHGLTHQRRVSFKKRLAFKIHADQAVCKIQTTEVRPRAT